MAHSKDPVGHWKDLETWLSVVTGSLLPKAAETLQPLTQNQLDENIDSIMKQDPSQSFNHKELAKITGTLSHTLIATLKLSDRHASQLQHKLTRLQARIEQLELEAQERLQQPNEVDEGTTEEIDKLQEALTAITEEREQARADHADVANKLDYAEQLLKEAKVDLRDKKARIKALETHLSEARHEIDRLMQEVDDIKEESASELRHAYALRYEPPKTRCAPASPLPSRTGSPVPELSPIERGEKPCQRSSPTPSEEPYLTPQRREPVIASHRSSYSLDLKDLDKLARNIGKFTPSVSGGLEVHAYLQDIDFHLEMRPNVSDKERLYLLRATSSTEVRSFLDRQPARVKNDYRLLQEALIREFANPESDQGLLSALETKQARNESPHAYYNRLRQSFFGTRNEPNMEEDLNFKILFLRNLHPAVSQHLGVLACPRTMSIQHLRDLTQKAHDKQKMVLEKNTKTATVLAFNTQNPELALEGAQRPNSVRPPSPAWNASSSNRQRNSYDDTRPKQRNSHWDGPRGQRRSPEHHQERNQWGSNKNWSPSKGRHQNPVSSSPRSQRRYSKHFHSDNAQTQSQQEENTPPGFDPQELVKLMMKEFLKCIEEDRKREKEKADSA
ncbi:uncharacterized protein [Danio rerio]|uniref:Uncharacterized protein n=1 Tax=Danio rerio TaxID=7955 RepID=A0AC58I0Y3_DANRE